MRIYIPSAHRATARQMLQGPLTRLPQSWHRRTFLTVPHGQWPEYNEALESLEAHHGWTNHGVTILETPRGMRGIGPTRHWLAEHAHEDEVGRLVMMDDDVDFLVRRSPEDWRLRAQTETETDEMLSTIFYLLSGPGGGQHAMVGISSREGNNRAGIGPWDADNMVSINTRIMRVFGVDVGAWLRMEHGRVEVMEDFDLTLQLLRAGHTNACLHYWANGQSQTNSPGGCSVYRSHEVQDASARLLADLHPGLVRLRLKENKTDRLGLGTRTEVTIMWKRAAEEGQRRA